ncbi:PD-(D/E)XK nuclease family protein [Paraburkholderia nemoris]|uniref:PDDEXK-like family protein n=1 Tax=Paraburkholderia nemoris TaxID=2793076 RepID=UPI0038BBCA3F
MSEFSAVTQELFEAFLDDPALTRAIEVSRRVDDVFDLINPNENQHSSILQWLFDPREGHGQGEEIFKDFLAAVYLANRESAKPQKLFEHWTPGRIAISGFQSLIVIREKSMVGTGRQDLFLVDPVHRVAILVENKAGASWKGVQLDSYRVAARELFKRGRPYYGYQIGYVLLDRYKDETTTADDAAIRFWAYLDYAWLEKAAKRAEARVERGVEPGQQLVISYCRRQAEYESKVEKELDELLAELARSHRPVVAAIGRARRQKHVTAKDPGLNTFMSQLWVWTHQHKDLAVKLEQQKSLSFIKHELSRNAGERKLVFDIRKRVIGVADKTWKKLMVDEPDEDGYDTWPISIRVREVLPSGGSDVEDTLGRPARYAINVNFRQFRLQDKIDEAVRSAIAPLYQKDLASRPDAAIRRIGQQIVGENDVPRVLLKVLKQLTDVLDPIVEGLEG